MCAINNGIEGIKVRKLRIKARQRQAKRETKKKKMTQSDGSINPNYKTKSDQKKEKNGKNSTA